MKTNILVLCGVSGSGKTYIRNLIKNTICMKDLSFHIPMQVTTRKKRYEEGPCDYIFLSKEDFDILADNEELVAYTNFNEKEYGTIKNNICPGNNVINLIVASAEGCKDILNVYKENNNVNIKTALVLSDLDEKILKSHNDRTLYFAKKELCELLEFPHDFYVPNYKCDRVNEETIKRILGVFKE